MWLVGSQARTAFEPRPLDPQPAQDLDATDPRQRDVEDEDVPGVLTLGLQHAAAVLGLAHDLDVGLALEQLAEPEADQGVVVGEEDPDRRGHGSTSRPDPAVERDAGSRGDRRRTSPDDERRRARRVLWSDRPVSALR